MSRLTDTLEFIRNRRNGDSPDVAIREGRFRWRLITFNIPFLAGLLIVIAIVPVLYALPAAGIAWLLAGGILYSAGVLFFISHKFLAHTVWHLLVLAGSACHVLSVYTVL